MKQYKDELWKAYFLVNDEKVETIFVIAACEEQAKQKAINMYNAYEEYDYVNCFDFIKVVKCEKDTY